MEYDVNTTRETGPAPELRAYEPLPSPAKASAPLVHGAVGAVFATLAGVGAFAAGMVAAPASWIIAALSVILALAAGVTGFDVPQFSAGRPLVAAGLVGPITAFAGVLTDFAAPLPEGPEKGAICVVVIICAGLAGVTIPRPTR